MDGITATQWVTIGTSGFTAICGFFFMFTYAVHAPWRKNEVGRQIMLLCGAISLILFYAVVVLFLPSDAQDFLRVIRGFGVMVLGWLFIRQARMVVSIQKKFSKEGR